MNFDKLSLCEKLAFVNLAATLINTKLISVPAEQLDEEEIVNFLTEQAIILFNKSKFAKNS